MHRNVLIAASLAALASIRRGIEADHKRIESNIARAYADEAAGLR